MAGRMPVRRVFRLVERLQVDPASVYRARLLGGEHWHEWVNYTPEAERLDLVVDAIMMHIQVVTTKPGTRVRPPTPVPRPTRAAEADPKPIALDDLPILAAMVNSD